MTKLRELFSDTLVYGISSVVARFIGYLLVPLHTGVFDQDKYGIVSLIFAAIALFNVLFTLGMESSYIRYAKDRGEAHSIFTTLQLFLLGSSGFLVLIIWLFQPLIVPAIGLQSGDPIFGMMLGILFFDTLAVVPFAELRIARRPVLFAFLKTGNVLINLGLNFALILGLGYGIEAVFMSNLVASMLTAIVVCLILLPMFKGRWNRVVLNKALIFGLPFVPAGFGHVINEMMDRFFLKGMNPETVQYLYGSDTSPEDVVGIYSACYKLAVFMLLLVQMFRMAWQPFFMREADDESAPRTFANTFVLFNIAAAAVFLFVALFAEQIVALKVPILNFSLVDERYWSGLGIVPVILMAYWFQGWYVNFSAGIFISEKSKRLAQITLMGAVVTIVFNLILVPYFGMMGSAFATLLSYAAMAFMILYYSTKLFSVPYNITKGVGVLALSATAVFLKPFFSAYIPEVFASLILFIAALSGIALLTLPSVKSS